MPGRAASAELAWNQLRHRLAAEAAQLSMPRAGMPGVCAQCLGPARPGSHRCFPCELHAQSAPGVLADVMVPIAYAPKGTRFARYLWQYKSERPGAAAAAWFLAALLLVFLREHGPCVWRAGQLEAPTHLAVVPSGRGRAGPHPLRALVSPFLLLPWADLAPRSGGLQRVRDLDPGRFAAQNLRGARVLLLDDTWTTGSSVQSAALTLRLAGAKSVAAVVLGRHVAAAGSGQGGAGQLPAAGQFRLDRCAVHDVRPAVR